MKYINKLGEQSIWNAGFVQLFDFSRANLNQESREEAVCFVASECYGSSPTDTHKLYDKLLTEHCGGPASSFEFVCDWDDTSLNGCLRNNPDMRTFEGTLSEIIGIQMMTSACFNRVATFRLKVPIFIARQIMRHRSFGFQEQCISGDSKISTSKGLRTLEDLYAQQYKKGTDGRIPRFRVFNEDSGEFDYANGVVSKAGEKDVFMLVARTSNSRIEIKATKDHKFLTKNGWKKLSDLNPGDFIAINGCPVWHDKDFLSRKKKEFLSRGIGMKGMAKELNINYNTLKKAMHKFGLQYTPKETASTFTVWNKGILCKKSYAYGRVSSNETREKISDALSKDYVTSSSGFRKRAATYWEAEFRRDKIIEKSNGVCAICGKKEKLEIDHILCVSLHPELAFEEDNVQAICKECHNKKTINEQSVVRLTARYIIVESISKCGKEETYDIDIDHPSHNYIANRFVVHNSRRYQDAEKSPFEFWNNGVLCEELLDDILDEYDYMVGNMDVAPEVARSIIPQSAYTTFFIQGDLDAWINYFMVRMDAKAQKEHRELADVMLSLLSEHKPKFFEHLKKSVDIE